MGVEELLSCTPRYFGALVAEQLETLKRADRKQEFLFGQLTAMVANCGFLRFDKPRMAEDFMPSEWAKKVKPQRTRRRSRKAIAAEMRATLDAVFR